MVLASSQEMRLTELSDYLDTHEPGKWRNKFANFSLLVVIGHAAHQVRFGNGTIEVSAANANTSSAELTFKITEDDWRQFLRRDAPAGYQSLSAMYQIKKLDIDGEMLLFYRHIMLLEGAFQSLRKKLDPIVTDYPSPIFEPVKGGYIRMNIKGVPHRIYYEEAGEGVPLLCLHTAGADGRQYREVLNDPEITQRYRVIVFDMPLHGKSSPPAGFQKDIYRLTTDLYVDTVMAIKEVLQLEQPIVMGCSIGGRAVLHLSLRHGEQFKAAIGLQSATHAAHRSDANLSVDSPLWRPDVHGGETAGGMMEMLVAPQSPDHHKWETLWHYMQGGPGIFAGDIFYYVVDGDMRNGIAEQIDTKKCPLYLLTGEYDVSATPAMTEELANLVDAQYFEVMEGLGHFPMSENPEKFLAYLKPVLEMVESQ
jgi:pimeloyl-ACP methyl ester carboxylesterase